LNPIIFRNISHEYSGSTVVKNISFEIEENIITAIIGRSGAGKSTLLQIINGLIVPTAGEILVFGKHLDYKSINVTRQNIGYSVQGTGLFPHMTVYENISILGRITGRSKNEIDERIKTLMKLVDLDPDFISKYPYQLSGGEEQRVGICRSMLLNPGIFLLDEAFSALDITTRNEIHKEVLKLQQFEPRTIILVTHDLREAMKLGDRIMLIEKGEIQQYGTKEEILNRPANDFVREFVQIQNL
jgi:osmoprotectant transport system ATP-binding protein